MSFWQLLNILKARWKTALSVLLLTLVAAAVASALLPRKYSATASIVVDLKSPDPITGTLLQSMTTQNYMATQVDVIQSPRVAKQVIDTLKLIDGEDVKKQWLSVTKGRGDIRDWLADDLLAHLIVTPSRESNVLNVTYESPSAQVAESMANAFAQAYVDTVLALRVQPARESSKFFDTQAKQAREQLEASQARLSAYQQLKGLLVTDERLDVENTRLDNLTRELVMAESESATTSSRSAQVGRQGASLQDVTSNPVIGGLKAQLATERTRLRELLSRYGDAHPQVIQSRSMINEIESRVREETSTITTGVTMQAQINQQRVKTLQAHIAEQRAKVLKMRADRDEAAVLQRDVENAQKAYDAVVNRATQTSLESQTQLSNVSVLNPAGLPLMPSSPKVLFNLTLAAFLGTLLAVFVAMLLELLDRRMRGPEDVVASVGLHVIGSLPKPGSKLRRTRRGVMLARQQSPALGMGGGPAQLPAPEGPR